MKFSGLPKKNCYFQSKQGIPRTTSVCFIKDVLIEVSCKLISCKSLSLIKIEDCLGGVWFIQLSQYLLFLSNNRSSYPRRAVRNRNFDNFSKVLEKNLRRILLFSKVIDFMPQCCRKRMSSQVCFEDFAESLVAAQNSS